MDVIDRGVEYKPKYKRRLVTEKLTTTPWIQDMPSTFLKFVGIGNTGFGVTFGPGQDRFDFVPEDSVDYDSFSAAKYATILGVSFLELRKFLNDTEERQKLDLDESKITTIFAKTNTIMVRAIDNLFSKSNVPNLAVADGEKITVNLQGFKSLPDNDPLIEYLSQALRRSKDITVTYTKTISNS